jgi:hypothetical protein
MRRALALALLFGLAACKKKPPEEAPAPPPVAAPVAAPAPEAPAEIVDALNPPPPAPPPDLATPTDTASAKRPQIDNANAEAQKRIQACLDGMPASALPGGSVRLQVTYTVGNDGKAHDIKLEGVGPEMVTCGKGAIEGVPFPTFNGPGPTLSFNLTYSRPQPTPPDAKPPTP